nr:unnamed protein product [Mus musculus]|eukprot:XP_001473368.1 PREDICTED: uncharacterized protein 1700066C05Rik [Mus musculus]
MLLGQGRFAQQQTGYPLQVFEQVNQIAIREWKALPIRGEASENLTLVLTPQMDTQDQTEPLWVLERLVRCCKNEAPDPVAPVDVVDGPTSTNDGAEMGDPLGVPEANTSST